MMISIHNLGLVVGILIGLAWALGYYQGMKKVLSKLKES